MTNALRLRGSVRRRVMDRGRERALGGWVGGCGEGDGGGVYTEMDGCARLVRGNSVCVRVRALGEVY